MKAAALCLLLVATPAWAGLTRIELASVSATPSNSARLDPALAMRDADGRMRRIGALLAGRTGLVTFVDYTCNTLCGTELTLLSHALAQSHAAGGRYRILAIGIDPKDDARSARAFARKTIPRALMHDAVLLLPGKTALASLTRSLGFRYVYDPAIDQFAHPAVVYVAGGDGVVRATLSPFALTTADMNAVLGDPHPALWQRVRMLCYAYDPATGIYTLRLVWLLRAAAVFTLLALGGAAALWNRRRAA